VEIYDIGHMLDTYPGVWEAVCAILSDRDINYTCYEFVNCISSDGDYEVSIKHEQHDFSLTLDLSRSEDRTYFELNSIRTWQ